MIFHNFPIHYSISSVELTFLIPRYSNFFFNVPKLKSYSFNICNNNHLKMVNVKTEIKISAPLKMVSEYASNPDNAVKWYDKIKSVEWVTPKQVSTGSKIMFKANFLNRELVYTYVIIELIENTKIVMSTSEGPFPMETTYEFKTINENLTYMSLTNRGIPSGFSKIFKPFMTFAMKRANTKDLKKLKHLLERENNKGE